MDEFDIKEVLDILKEAEKNQDWDLVNEAISFMEEYLESILKSKSKENDVLEKEKPEEEPKEINSVLQRQLKSLKNSMDTYGLTTDDIVNHLKKNNE